MGFKLNIFQNSKLIQIVTQNASAKWLPQSGYISNPFSKAILEIDSRKLLPKVAAESCSQSCVLKLFHKGAPHSNVLPIQTVQSCRAKLLLKAAPAQSCSEQLLSLPPKVVQSNCSSMLLQSCKVTPHSCSSKLLPKTTSQRRSPKLQSCDSANLFTKTAPQSHSPEAASQSCFPKLFPKVPLQSGCPYASNPFPKAILPSGSRKLLPKVAAESCSPKLRFKATPRCSRKLRFFKAAP